MKRFLLAPLSLILLLLGCTSSRTFWKAERLPVTQEEVALIESHVRQTLCTTRGDLTLSGDSQNIDDYAAIVYHNACQNLCKPRMFEYRDPGGFLGGCGFPEKTGRWREMTEDTNAK